MKPRLLQREFRAFTSVDLTIVIATAVLFVVFFLPQLARPKRTSCRTFCSNNLKQVGLSFRLFATDNGDVFPMELSTNLGGTKEFVQAPYSAFRHLLAMSNELSTPFVVVCPEDKGRTRAANWAGLSNRAVSYFIGLEATETNPQSILSGDRYLTSSRSMKNGFLVLTTNDVVRWTKNYHTNHGNLGLGDGRVTGQLDSTNLQQALRDSGVTTNRLALPELPP
jgi:competence protein ComGC